MSDEMNIHSDQYIDNQVELINGLLSERNYARLSNMSSISGDLNRARRIDRKTVRSALANPISKVDTLQEVSSILKYTNGIYANVLKYNANMLLNDYMLIPKSIEKMNTKEKAEKAFLGTSNFMRKFNIKSICPVIISRTIEQGEYYFYKTEQGDKFVIQEMPNWMCKIVGKVGEVFKYAINLQKLNDTTVEIMPREIQLAYNRFKSKDKAFIDELMDKTFYVVNGGCAFTLDPSSRKGVPFYANIFDDLMELEDMKDLKSENAIVESIKLLHQKVPFDKDTKKPMLSVKEMTAYHYSTKDHLPKGTSITTNPLDLQAVTLADSGSKLGDRVEEATKMTFDTAGINKELFNGTKNSNEAIAMGIVVDSLLPFSIQSQIEDWLNYELRSNKSTSNWEMKFVGTTRVNQDTKIGAARENATVGMPLFELMATSGYEPHQCTNVRKLENLLGISDIMIPQKTSHTISSNDSGRTKGNTEGASITTEEE